MRSLLAVYACATVVIVSTVACAGRRPNRGVVSLVQSSNCDGVVELTVSNYSSRDLTLVARTTVLQVVVGTIPPGVHSYEVKPSPETWYEAHAVDSNDVIARESPAPHFHNPIGSVVLERTCRSTVPA
jgi:hypothetical protein